MSGRHTYLAANNSQVWKYRANGYPMGWMFSPAGGYRNTVRDGVVMPYAVDNGMFYPFGGEPKGMKDIETFYTFLRRVKESGTTPLFVTVVDAPYDAARTRELYPKHQRHLREIWPGMRAAMAVQDGMTFADLDMIEGPGCVFIGGSTEWKWKTMRGWVEEAKRRGLWSHVARVNTIKRIRQCVDAEAETSDGTGIWRGDKKQLRGVLDGLTEGHLFLRREPE